MALYRCSVCGTTAPTSPITCDSATCRGAATIYARVREPKGGHSVGPVSAPAGRGAINPTTGIAHGLVKLSATLGAERPRTATGVAEFDRVAGGGLVHGSLVLIAGEPGIGKSTLLLQIVAALVGAGKRALYVSGEESAPQIKLRAERLGLNLDDLTVLSETDLGIVTATLYAEQYDFAVVDSIQTMSSEESDGVSGGVAQIKHVTTELLRVAKTSGTTLLLVGHVTKDAGVAGPKTLEHLVDAVFIIEGDRHSFFRVLRATKNRFGATDEIGTFEMREAGMIGVESPTVLHIEGGVSYGRALCPVVEGSRPLLVEVGALVAAAAYSSPRRVALGVPEKRVAMLLAVLERYADIDLSNHDVYVDVSPAIGVNEPAIDAAVVAAIASSYWSTSIPEDIGVVGEIRLGGGLGPVRALSSRAKELVRQGGRRLIGPNQHPVPSGLTYNPVVDVKSLLTAAGVLRPAGAVAAKGRRFVPEAVMRGRRTGPGDDD